MCSSFFVFWSAMYTTFLLIILLLSIKKKLIFHVGTKLIDFGASIG